MYTINKGSNRFISGKSTEWADIDSRFNTKIPTETNASILVLATIDHAKLYLTTDRMRAVDNEKYGIQYRIIIDDQETSSFVNHQAKWNMPLTLHLALPVKKGTHTIKIQYKLSKNNMKVTWTMDSRRITIMVVPN